MLAALGLDDEYERECQKFYNEFKECCEEGLARESGADGDVAGGAAEVEELAIDRSELEHLLPCKRPWIAQLCRQRTCLGVGGALGCEKPHQRHVDVDTRGRGVRAASNYGQDTRVARSARYR